MNDTTAIEMDEAMARLGIDSEAYLRLLAAFARDLPTKSDTLAASIAGRQTREASRLAHAVAGPCLSLGLTDLARAAKALERSVLADSQSADAAQHEFQAAEIRTLAGIQRLTTTGRRGRGEDASGGRGR